MHLATMTKGTSYPRFPVTRLHLIASALKGCLVALVYGKLIHRHILKGRLLGFPMDHNPLNYAFHKLPEKHQSRELRHFGLVPQCPSNVQHVSGADTAVANALYHVDTSHNQPYILEPQRSSAAQSTHLDAG